jgi:hypothetical protein
LEKAAKEWMPEHIRLSDIEKAIQELPHHINTQASIIFYLLTNTGFKVKEPLNGAIL